MKMEQRFVNAANITPTECIITRLLLKWNHRFSLKFQPTSASLHSVALQKTPIFKYFLFEEIRANGISGTNSYSSLKTVNLLARLNVYRLWLFLLDICKTLLLCGFGDH
jgi:hypothetical protein